ncbi:MAG: phosphatase PAP2 family protein [Pseudomonadota bacterium]
MESLIPPPPAVGSPTFNEQMAVVEWHQQTRTPAQVEFVETTLNVERFAPVLGDALFTVDGLELKQTIDDAIDEARAEYDGLKEIYDLPRPFVANENIEPIGEARPVSAYPSGHSIRAIIYARLLAEVFPEHEEALMDLAMRVGHGRVIAGAHYPIDVTAGQTLGQAYADVIVEQPAFKEALERIFGRQPPSRVTETP